MPRRSPLPATIYTPQGTQSYDYVPTDDDCRYMDMALEQAGEAMRGGDSPIGATLVTPAGVYVAQTTEFREGNLLGHAELNAIKQAQEERGRFLGQCVLYTTAEPCVMCSYALDKGQLGMLVVAATREDAPDFFRKRSTTLHDIWGESRRTLTVVRGLRRVEAARLLTANAKRH